MGHGRDVGAVPGSSDCVHVERIRIFLRHLGVGMRQQRAHAATLHTRFLTLLLITLAMPPAFTASEDDVADESMRQFLAQSGGQHSYRAIRRLEAENGKRTGWLEATTEYSPLAGFRYQVTAESGSSFVRDKLREMLELERTVIARQPARYSLVNANYVFRPRGVDAAGLAAIDVSPKREDHVLVKGTIFLSPADGALVQVKGRLVKNPSFWVRNVDVIRNYDRIVGVVVPVVLESRAQLRIFGPATLRVTYSYLEIDGRSVSSTVAGLQ